MLVTVTCLTGAKRPQTSTTLARMNLLQLHRAKRPDTNNEDCLRIERSWKSPGSSVDAMSGVAGASSSDGLAVRPPAPTQIYPDATYPRLNLIS